MAPSSIVGLGHLDLTRDRWRLSHAMVGTGDGLGLFAKWQQRGFRGWPMVHPDGLAVTAVVHDPTFRIVTI